MINFIEGKINLGSEEILSTSDSEHLDALAEASLIEKRKGSKEKNYYYVETAEDGMRFGVFIRLRGKNIEWLLLRWLDRPMKGWDDVSEKAMIDEYRLLSNFVKNKIGAPPNNRRTGTHTWRITWGKIEVSYEVRSFDVVIFMKPR